MPLARPVSTAPALPRLILARLPVRAEPAAADATAAAIASPARAATCARRAACGANTP